MRGGRILVAGATGRVGGGAVRHLLEAGFEVRALARSAAKGERLRSMGAEPVVGDVTKPASLAPAVRGCAGVFSALSSATEREAEEVKYRGNVNLLSAAREAGASRFVYSSALLVDHPLAREVGTFREKVRFKELLLAEDGVSPTILRPVMFMETLLMASSGRIAFVAGRQRRIVSWISADDEAYRRLSAVRGRKIFVLHPPLSVMRLAGHLSPSVKELVSMFTLFDAAGYFSDSPALRETFGVEAATIEQWARRVSGPGAFG